MTNQTKLPTFTPGDNISVTGIPGQYRVHGYGRDGSLLVWGGSPSKSSYRYSFRSIDPTTSKIRKLRKHGPCRIPELAPPASRKAGTR